MHCSQSRSRLLIIARSPVASARNQIQPRPNNCGRSPPRTPAGLQDGPILVTCSTDRHRQGLGVASHRPSPRATTRCPGSKPASSTGGGEGCCPRPSAWSGLRQADGTPHNSPSTRSFRIQDHLGGTGVKTYLLHQARAPMCRSQGRVSNGHSSHLSPGTRSSAFSWSKPSSPPQAKLATLIENT
jgi:hypothetical protein